MRWRWMGLLVLGCALARAQDRKPPPKPFAVAQKDFSAAYRGTDAAALARAVKELARSALMSDDKREKSAARAALKRCLKKKAPEVRVAALKAYTTLSIKGSSRDLKPLLSQAAQGRLPHEVAVAVVVTWGELADAGTHKDLLAIVKKPVEPKAGRQLGYEAARALRRYRRLPKKKLYDLVASMMIVFDQLYAIAHRRAKEGSTDVKWWDAVKPGMVESFNALTGARGDDYYTCYEWWQENRRKMKDAK